MPHISILRCGFRQRAASLQPRPLTCPTAPPGAKEVMGHEDLFITIHNHLPPERVHERELLICRL